jgi:two-component system response regulator RegA
VGTEPAESSEGPFEDCTALPLDGAEGLAVLVADGTPCGEALAAEFGQLGLTVRLATDLADATAVALRERPALAVVELRLRRGCGLELIGRIKEGSPTTQTVVATMYGSIDTALASIRRGAVDCLTKPVTAVEILMSPAAVLAPVSLQNVPAWLGLQAARKRYIEDVLAHCGSLASTARALHIDRKSLRRMMRRFFPGESSPSQSEFLEDRNNA